MILVGQYHSPYARRVAVSLRVLGFEYEHDRRSVFGDFDSMLQTNPVGRVPCLVLDDGEVLIESGAILDWLDQTVGPERALVPPAGLERRRALKLIAVAAGATDKAAASSHDRIVRPVALRWPQWIARCRRQIEGASRRAGSRAVAGRSAARPGADHDRLPVPLPADDGSRASAARSISCAREALGALRGAAGVPGHLAVGSRASQGRVRARETGKR